MARKKIIAGNWKMNLTLPEGEVLIRSIREQVSGLFLNCEIIIAPSFINIPAVVNACDGSPIKIAAQNCNAETHGAFTGEVSAKMIKAAGANHVIIGHSERRMLYHENNELLLKKIHRALENDLIPVYCIGETLAERESKKQFDVVQQQLQDVLYMLNEEQASKVILAYEPVWAIGTGKTATPAQAQEMHNYIRSLIHKKNGEKMAGALRILYGGSCNAENAAQLFSQSDVDGGLIGGASLKADDFVKIIKAAN